jgi:dihydroorotate dehydrogenase electron transfer subunit
MDQCIVRVLENVAIAKDYYQLRIQLPENHGLPEAGQFLTFRIGEGIAPLLRRPFAFSAYNSKLGQAEIIYERRGNATQILTSYAPNDQIDYLGPLGNRFPMPTANVQPILVGGGIGMGPILFLYNTMISKGLNPVLAIGSRNADRLPRLPESTIVATDDGSLGHQGTVLGALQNKIATSVGTKIEMYTCGPSVMMQNLWQWAHTAFPGTRVHVSLEQTMACAVGACMGCVVKTTHPRPYARVCTEGPVFLAHEIAWGEV